MSKLKITGYSILGLIGFVALLFFLNFVGIVEMKIFGVAREDARREIFEETKSFVHANIQALSKYKYEWDRKPEDRESIETLIRSEFAAFDADKIKSYKLRQFLIKARGF